MPVPVLAGVVLAPVPVPVLVLAAVVWARVPVLVRATVVAAQVPVPVRAAEVWVATAAGQVEALAPGLEKEEAAAVGVLRPGSPASERR